MDKNYIRLAEAFNALDRLWEADEQSGADVAKEPAKEQPTVAQPSTTSGSENPIKIKSYKLKEKK